MLGDFDGNHEVEAFANVQRTSDVASDEPIRRNEQRAAVDVVAVNPENFPDARL